MDSDLKHIKNDIMTYCCYNKIYYLSSSEKDKYETIKKWLKEDYGFLDIVLDFDDYKKLGILFENIPDDKTDEQKNMVKSIIARTYLCYSILNKANISKTKYGEDISNIGQILFNGDYNGFFKLYSLSFNDGVRDLLNLEAKNTEKGEARIHFLFDEVHDETLQKNINDLFIYRGRIAMMGYVTTDLKTYKSTNSSAFLESPHDYISFETKIKRKEYI